jgi:ABC-2 type transport system permease protein
MWLPLVGCIWAVRHFTNDTSAFDVGTLAATYLGILLLGGLFIALGCCASALTRSQVAAAMVSLALGASLFLVAYLAKQVPAQAGWQTEALASFSLFDQMHDFARGIVDTRSVVLFASLTFFVLLLTLRVVEGRRWK